MPPILTHNSYGQSAIRLMQVRRRGDLHELRDITVDVRLGGEFAHSFAFGDTSMVVSMDAMKNTVEGFARDLLTDDLELFGLALTDHFLGSTPGVRRVRVELLERTWQRLVSRGRPQMHSFVRGDDSRFSGVSRSAEAVAVEAGVRQLTLIKSDGSAPETGTDAAAVARPLALTLDVTWRYTDSDVPFNLRWKGIRQAMIEAFAEHTSRSIQHTIFVLGRAALDACDELIEVHFAARTHTLRPLDLSSPREGVGSELFLVADDPHGVVEATIVRS